MELFFKLPHYSLLWVHAHCEPLGNRLGWQGVGGKVEVGAVTERTLNATVQADLSGFVDF